MDDGRLARQTRVRVGGSSLVKDRTFAYDRNGNRSSDERGTFAFNSRDELSRWTRTGGASSVTYELDGTGQTVRTVDTQGPSPTTTTYTYNAQQPDRLLSVTASAPGALSLTRTYTYDLFGATRQVTTRVGAQAPTSVGYGVDPFERQTEINRPDAATETVRLTYDGLDRRASKQTGPLTAPAVRYRYVGDTALLSEENGADARTRAYDYASDGERLGQATRLTTPSLQLPQPQSMTSFSYGTTGAGDVEDLEAAADPSSGTPSQRQYQYDPYGTVLNQAALDGDAQQNPFRYGGHYYDTGPDSYDLGARTYTPTTGRYLSQDRYEDASADQGLLADPLTNGRYAYVAGNPVNRMDWDGHRACLDGCTTQPAVRAQARADRRSTEIDNNRSESGGRSRAVDSGRSTLPSGDGVGGAPAPARPAPAPAPAPAAEEDDSGWFERQGGNIKDAAASVNRAAERTNDWANGFSESVVPYGPQFNRVLDRNGLNPGYHRDSPYLEQGRDAGYEGQFALAGGLAGFPEGGPAASAAIRALLAARGITAATEASISAAPTQAAVGATSGARVLPPIAGGAPLLGEGGVQVTSRTLLRDSGKGFRVDVENPAPGLRPGQLHLQDAGGGKYLYDFDADAFTGLPRALQKRIADDPNVARAISKGRDYLNVKHP